MKLVIVVLVLIAVLFVIALAVGFSHDDAALTLDQPAWLQSMQRRLEGERLQPDEVLTDCLKGNSFVIPVGSTCRVKILRSDARLRKMSLTVPKTDVVHVILEPNTDSGVALKLKLDKQMTKAPDLVFVKGRHDPPLVATLELTCERTATLPPSRCTVQLE